MLFRPRLSGRFRLLFLALFTLIFLGCTHAPAPTQAPVRPSPPRTAAVPSKIKRPLPRPMPAPTRAPPAAAPRPGAAPAVMLGIDVLAAGGFAELRGKRVGLLTHPAGVNRRGEFTIDVLRRAPGVRLVSLFAPEHGLYGLEKASALVDDTTDRRTGLPVYSLHGANRKPTAAQLRGLDALVIDLQDIGSRSYTFNVVMRYAMDACFAQGVEVVVLDRPNPLGGLKVEGPGLDREWMSGVGAFQIPYVHGLTMGELARWAAGQPGVLDVPEAVRRRGRLTVIPMRGWRRTMRWPDTGLTFVPTSTYVRDFAAAVGYAATGLGCEYSGFKHGLDSPHPFRLLSFPGRTSEQLQRDLAALRLPGLRFITINPRGEAGSAASGVYVEVANWEQWQPTQLSFHLMRLACRYDPPNPFASLDAKQARSFNIHVGSTAWWQTLRRDGARADVEAARRVWRSEAAAFQKKSRSYWLYN